MTFVVVLHGLWAAAPLAGALKDQSRTDLALAIAWGSVLGLNLWRLLQRACLPHENGLRVRGFWRSYKVDWERLQGLVVTPYSFAGVPTGARVFVVFEDLAGSVRGVAVSSSRRDRTALRKAAEIRAWLPPERYAMVQITESALGEPDEAHGEWRRVGARPPTD